MPKRVSKAAQKAAGIVAPPNGGQMAGELLRRFRKRQRLTQGQLATKASVTKTYISRIENGQVREPGREVMTRLAIALEVPVDEFARAMGWSTPDASSDTWTTIRRAVGSDTRLSDDQKQGILIVLKEFFPKET